MLPLFSLIFVLIHIYYACLYFYYCIIFLYLGNITPKLFLCHTSYIFLCHHDAQISLEHLYRRVTLFNFSKPYLKYVITLSNFFEKSLILDRYSVKILVTILVSSMSSHHYVTPYLVLILSKYYFALVLSNF